MIANRSGSFTKTKRVWVVLIMAVMLAGSAVFTATAQAGSFDRKPPNAVLMKDKTVLQTGIKGSTCWTYYRAGEGWAGSCVDRLYRFPRADLVRAGSRLHIRINKPQRPETFKVYAYKGFDKEGMWPIGKPRRLDTTLRRVERDGKTVAWNVFIGVNRPDRHYYLETFGRWQDVPGTHISYGDALWFFHVKTR
jgi:hypothetical protein